MKHFKVVGLSMILLFGTFALRGIEEYPQRMNNGRLAWGELPVCKDRSKSRRKYK